MVVLLRATMSPGLYYQMVGRGLRLHDGKENCRVLDFGGNVKRHGPIDDIRVRGPSGSGGEAPSKECPECNEVVPIGYSNCPDCGHAFPPPDAKPRHEPKASDDAILTDQIKRVRHTVTAATYSVHYKKGWEEGQPRTVRVDYFDGMIKVGSEWVCIEHDGYALKRSHHWWMFRCGARFPQTCEEAVAIANLDLIRLPLAIFVKEGGRFPEIVDYEFDGGSPEEVDSEWLDGVLARMSEVDDSEVPF
jgi:DNA repair protein RadD